MTLDPARRVDADGSLARSSIQLRTNPRLPTAVRTIFLQAGWLADPATFSPDIEVLAMRYTDAERKNSVLARTCGIGLSRGHVIGRRVEAFRVG